MAIENALPEILKPVQRAFSKQAENYDADDRCNPILQDWRETVYDHLQLFLMPGSRILELNAGTGIDARHLAEAGHTVHATDTSPGMVKKIKEKINQSGCQKTFTVQQCSFESLDAVGESGFDYIFSNFGGLNCCKDLITVARQLPRLMKKRGYVTWVIMPPVCPWEFISVLKGNSRAFRRLNKEVIAHLEGEYFKTYYHSASEVKKALGPAFRMVRSEGLGSISPPPSSLSFISKYPGLYKRLKKLDKKAAGYFPFNRWADHIIITFQLT